MITTVSTVVTNGHGSGNNERNTNKRFTSSVNGASPGDSSSGMNSQRIILE